jgi:hypothetical protein
MCCVAWLIAATPARSQPGSVSIFGDPELTDCNIHDTVGIVDVYVAHLWSGPTEGVRFRVDPYPGFEMVYLAEESPYLTLGLSLNGVTVCYDACLSSPGLILTLRFFGQGLTPPCTYIRVVGHPEDDAVLVLDCDANVMYGSGGTAIVHPTPECLCLAGPGAAAIKGKAKQPSPDFCYWVPVERSSWGMIKSLYR